MTTGNVLLGDVLQTCCLAHDHVGGQPAQHREAVQQDIDLEITAAQAR